MAVAVIINPGTEVDPVVAWGAMFAAARGLDLDVVLVSEPWNFPRMEHFMTSYTRPDSALTKSLRLLPFYWTVAAVPYVAGFAREGATAGGGVLGGMAAGAATGLVCGPGAVVCSSVLVIAGGALGALGMSYVFDWVWE